MPLDPVDTLARTLYGEARGQGLDGMAAVANVIVNRANNPGWWGASIASVCTHPWQFSCWNEGDPNRARLLRVTDADPQFRDCLLIARAAVAGELRDRTSGANHYHATSIPVPKWARGRKPTVTIGDHCFYRIEP